MSYTAKHWVTLSDFTVENLNEMELGIQESHDDNDELDKRLTSLAIDLSDTTKKLNLITQDSSLALQAIKDIENILQTDEELADVIRTYGTNFLSKESQQLTDSELRTIYKNLHLTDYKFFTDVTINGEKVTSSSLNINYPTIDGSLNITSLNAVTNKAITQKINEITSNFNNYTRTDIIYPHIYNTITAEILLRQQGDAELKDLIESHTHNDMATKTFVRKEISLIPTPDVSGQINTHNLDKSSHPDIWEAINNMDLSDYALVNHHHDNTYSKLDHTHDYADSDHTHDMSDYVTISTDQVVTGKKRFVVSSGYSSPSIAKFFVGPADNTGFAFGNDGMQAFSGGNYSTMYINYYGGNVQIGNNKNNTLIAQKGTFASTISEEGKLLKDKYAALIHEHDYAPSTHEHNYLPLSGGTLTGDLTGKYISGTWLQSTSHSNLGKPPATYAVFQNGWLYSRTLEQTKSDLGVPTDYATSSHNHEGVYAPFTHTHDYATQANIDTAISDLKSWLLGTGNADTIDTIKDIADIMDEHKDILDALGKTYALKDHNHDDNYINVDGDIMTGSLTLPYNKETLKWQASSASSGYYITTAYSSNGDEGWNMSTGNNKASILFRTNGDTQVQWNQGTPTLHMKNSTVAINKSISEAKADYTLDVDGTLHATTLYESGVTIASKYSAIDHTHWKLKTGTGNTLQIYPGSDSPNYKVVLNFLDSTQTDLASLIVDKNGLPNWQYPGTGSARVEAISLASHTHDYAASNHTHDEYLPLTAGSNKPLTGTLYATSGVHIDNTNQSSALHQSGIVFKHKDNVTSTIGANNLGDLGIYASRSLYIRPGVSTDTTAGVMMSRTDFSPTTSGSMSLGTSTNKFNNIYGTAIYQNGKQVANGDDTVPNTRTINGKALSSNISLGNKDVGALPDYTLTINHGTAGNPRMVKFASVNYSSVATCFKMAAMTCHDNGVSYQFLTDMLIAVTTAGEVTANIYKFAQQEVGSVDGVARYTGDVFYVNDTTNKIVDFYILCGQYSSSQFTPVTKVGSTNIAYVTQYTGTATYYSSGTKVWVNGCGTTYARMSDLNNKLTGSKIAANNPNTFIGYNSEENQNSTYQVSFKANNQDYGICWSRFGNMTSSHLAPSACTYNGFFYVNSSTNGLSGADANPFLQYHPSNADFRILTTAYSDIWLQQIATDFRTPYMFTRRKEEGTWKSWESIWGPGAYPWRVETDSNNNLVFKCN